MPILREQIGNVKEVLVSEAIGEVYRLKVVQDLGTQRYALLAFNIIGDVFSLEDPANSFSYRWNHEKVTWYSGSGKLLASMSSLVHPAFHKFYIQTKELLV
jgi:hypothetical protein